jgi:thioredoxin 1
MAENVLNVTDGTFEQEVLTVEAIAKDYGGKLRVAKVNVDENAQTPSRYGIRGIPTLLIFKDGEVKEQLVGNHPRDNIEKAIEKHV